MEQATQAPVLSQPARDQQNRSANSGAPSAKAKQHAEAPPPEARPEIRRLAPPSNQPTVASVAPAARALKPPSHRQAGSHSEKPAERRALALMTLRTIEFADGHRVSRLIPYRSPERALAFEPNE
jgi:hypothetical protein